VADKNDDIRKLFAHLGLSEGSYREIQPEPIKTAPAPPPVTPAAAPVPPEPPTPAPAEEPPTRPNPPASEVTRNLSRGPIVAPVAPASRQEPAVGPVSMAGEAWAAADASTRSPGVRQPSVIMPAATLRPAVNIDPASESSRRWPLLDAVRNTPPRVAEIPVAPAAPFAPAVDAYRAPTAAVMPPPVPELDLVAEYPPAAEVRVAGPAIFDEVRRMAAEQDPVHTEPLMPAAAPPPAAASAPPVAAAVPEPLLEPEPAPAPAAAWSAPPASSAMPPRAEASAPRQPAAGPSASRPIPTDQLHALEPELSRARQPGQGLRGTFERIGTPVTPPASGNGKLKINLPEPVLREHGERRRAESLSSVFDRLANADSKGA